MIDIFFRRVMQDGFCRVEVIPAPDSIRAQALIEVLCCIDKSVEIPSAGGRPSRRRGSVAQLVSRRDAALDREITAKSQSQKPASHGNVLPYERAIS